MRRKQKLRITLLGCLITVCIFIVGSINPNNHNNALSNHLLNQSKVTTDHSIDNSIINITENSVLSKSEDNSTDEKTLNIDDPTEKNTPENDTVVEPFAFGRNSLTQIYETQGDSISEVDISLSSDLDFFASNEVSKIMTSSSRVAAKEEGLPLIYDCYSVDYKSYLPEMLYTNEIETALDITNPKIKISATSAILFDGDTKEVLYYKEPVSPVFPASTAKILSALVGLDWCDLDEEVTVGDEVSMIASDSSKANIRKGHVLDIETVLEGMLLPSGNDAAYVMAAYVGRKSLENPKASKEKAVKEFTRLMNEKAIELGAVNSNFVTPDGYDAIGQYTTAYDMGMIALEAAENKTIIKISKKSSAKNTLISGQTITWNTTNSLIKKDSPRYFPYAIGLKTGTTTMAGRCLLAAARKDDKLIVCVIMHSTAQGRWSDATKLLEYGLNN
jgi:D-alanyl-D-alanine carboxypeptidase (penicillin-binding protein 5/6)